MSDAISTGCFKMSVPIEPSQIPAVFDPWTGVIAAIACIPGAKFALTLDVTTEVAAEATSSLAPSPESDAADASALAERVLKVIRLHGPIFKAVIGEILGEPVDRRMTAALEELAARGLAHNSLRRGLWVATGAIVKKIPSREEQLEQARAGKLRRAD